MTEDDEEGLRIVLPFFVALFGFFALLSCFILIIVQGVWLSTIFGFVTVSLLSWWLTFLAEKFGEGVVNGTLKFDVTKTAISSIVSVTLIVVTGVGLKVGFKNKNYCFVDLRSEELKRRQEEEQRKNDQEYELDGATTVAEQNNLEDHSVVDNNTEEQPYSDEVSNDNGAGFDTKTRT